MLARHRHAMERIAYHEGERDDIAEMIVRHAMGLALPWVDRPDAGDDTGGHGFRILSGSAEHRPLHAMLDGCRRIHALGEERTVSVSVQADADGNQCVRICADARCGGASDGYGVAMCPLGYLRMSPDEFGDLVRQAIAECAENLGDGGAGDGRPTDGEDGSDGTGDAPDGNPSGGPFPHQIWT